MTDTSEIKPSETASGAFWTIQIQKRRAVQAVVALFLIAAASTATVFVVMQSACAREGAAHVIRFKSLLAHIAESGLSPTNDAATVAGIGVRLFPLASIPNDCGKDAVYGLIAIPDGAIGVAYGRVLAVESSAWLESTVNGAQRVEALPDPAADYRFFAYLHVSPDGSCAD